MRNKNLAQILTIVLVAALAGGVSTPVMAWGHHHGGYHRDFGNYYYPYPYYAPLPYYPIPPVVHHHKQPGSVVVMRAQVELENMGYYSGKVDGRLGARTHTAILLFQHDKGLAETGVLNEATLHALGINK
jgi:hypothetical protein